MESSYISLGGRVTLINSVLDSLPTYVMSLLPMPAKVEERLDKLRRDFLRKGNKEGKDLHLVKRQTAQLHKQSGGVVSCQNGYGGSTLRKKHCGGR